MNFLKCKLCNGNISIIGENSIIEPIVSCNDCGYTNKQNVYNKPDNSQIKKQIIIEYRK